MKPAILCRSIVAVGLLLVPALAVAGNTWKEQYPGPGSGDTRSEACHMGQQAAELYAQSACIRVPGGHEISRSGSCNAQSSFGGKVWTATYTVTVTCAK